MIKALAFLILAVGCASRGAPSDYAERTAMWNQVAQPSVLLRNIAGGSGSGTVIYQSQRRALVLTAAHVVGEDRAVFVERGDTKYVGTVLRRDADLDGILERLGIGNLALAGRWGVGQNGCRWGIGEIEG